MTPATTFNVYSITKPLTATTVVLLSAAGAIDLDAPIGEAADVRGLEHYGTVRETLLHRAGFRNPNPLRWTHSVESHDRFDEQAFVQERLAALTGTRRRLARSGYSNVGYLLLGLAIERASRRPFSESVTTDVLDRLRSGPNPDPGFTIPQLENHARGHVQRRGAHDLLLGWLVDRSTVVQYVAGRWVGLRLHYVNGRAWGGLIASARGLARFGEAVIGAGGLLPSQVRRQLLGIVPGPGPVRSLAWFGGRLCGRPWFAHAGGGLGAYGELRLYPDTGVVTVLLTNGPGFTDARCLDGIDGAWIDKVT